MEFLCSKMKNLGSKMDFGHADGHVTWSRTGSRGRSCSKMKILGSKMDFGHADGHVPGHGPGHGPGHVTSDCLIYQYRTF